MSKTNVTLNITILGEKNVGKSKLIDEYCKVQKVNPKKKQNKDYISVIKTIGKVELNLNLYEFSEIKERKKEISNHHCVIIVFDMTSRQAFEDVLDKWITYLRQINYNNAIILFSTKNYNDNDALPMTDKEEVESLLQKATKNDISYYIGDKTTEEKNKLIEQLIEETYSQTNNNKNNKDCIIF